MIMHTVRPGHRAGLPRPSLGQNVAHSMVPCGRSARVFLCRAEIQEEVDVSGDLDLLEAPKFQPFIAQVSNCSCVCTRRLCSSAHTSPSSNRMLHEHCA